MRLIAIKVTPQQYSDLVHTAHQRRRCSLSEHIRGVLIETQAMRPAEISGSSRLPSIAQLRLLQESPDTGRLPFRVKPNGRGDLRGRRVKLKTTK